MSQRAVHQVSGVILHMIAPENTMEQVVRIVGDVARNQRIIYVTVNRPYKQLIATLASHEIDHTKMFFIDCITAGGHVMEKNDPQNCMFIDSPQDLTGISIAITQAIKLTQPNVTLFIDSIDALVVYNDESTVVKFCNFTISKLRSFGAGGVLLARKSGKEVQVVRDVALSVDEVAEADELVEEVT